MRPDHLRALERAHARSVAFQESLPERPQHVTATLSELREAIGGPTPEAGSPSDEVIDRLADAVEPGLMGMAGPRFFGWVIGASHPAGIAADWLTSAWGQNAGLYTVTPAAAVVEEVAAGWLLDILQLQPECSVGFVTGATLANFTCLAAARGEILRQAGWDVEADGLFGAPPVHVYVGRDAHTTVFSALQYLGMGRERVIAIGTDDEGRMDAEALDIAMARHGGPAIVVTQAGQINTGAFDPVGVVSDIAHRHGAWVHVDGAFGLWARACPARAHLAEGVDSADSWATDGHKWLQTPYDCGYAIVRHPEAHRRAMAIGASYLQTAAGGAFEPRDYVPELSRRARGFATWAVLQALGREGIASLVDGHCTLAQRMAERLADEPGVRVVNRVELNQVIVQFGDGDPADRDAATDAVIAGVQREGACCLAGAEWHGQRVMRISVISWPTAEADIDLCAESILAAWRAVRG
ncbi:MAG: pyridoxal-dependent decarboxylase [Gemmatimonadota bacterium]